MINTGYKKVYYFFYNSYLVRQLNEYINDKLIKMHGFTALDVNDFKALDTTEKTAYIVDEFYHTLKD